MTLTSTEKSEDVWVGPGSSQPADPTSCRHGQNPDDPEATQKFQDLSRAYDTISNPEKRDRSISRLSSHSGPPLMHLTLCNPDTIAKVTWRVRRMRMTNMSMTTNTTTILVPLLLQKLPLQSQQQPRLKQPKSKKPIGYEALMVTGGITTKKPMNGGTKIHKET